MREYVRVKEEFAFRDIREKKCYITSLIPNTTDGVVIQIVGQSGGGYKFRRRDLEPYE